MFILELLLVLALILANGLLAMSELAIVSSRKARLETMAAEGSRGAPIALYLAADPGRFLSATQIGITLVGILAGAYSGATFAEPLMVWLQKIWPQFGVWADPVAFTIVVTGMTYISLIVGELVPKQIALADPETVAVRVAPLMLIIAKAALPIVVVLDLSARLVLKIVGGRRIADKTVTDEEIKSLVAEASRAGVVERAEEEMISGVMRLADRPIRAFMTPRHDVDWIDLSASTETILRNLRKSDHSRFPAAYGKLDEVVGIVQAKDILSAALDGRNMDIRSVLRKTSAIHDRADALEALEILKQSPVHMALVVDEYGTFEGVVTTADILEGIAGDFAEHDEAPPEATERADGSLLLDGALPIDRMIELLRIALPEQSDYHTVAGFALGQFGQLPKTGDLFTFGGWRFEVMDMDARRIDKILVTRQTGE
ncbi:MAG: hemolysin family protein [Alphaproteobacteria bacterium]